MLERMLEFGTYIGMRHYVSLSDVRIEKILLRFGWDPVPLGRVGRTANEDSIAFIYTVNQEMLENVRAKSKITGSLIVNLEEFSKLQVAPLLRKASAA